MLIKVLLDSMTASPKCESSERAVIMVQVVHKYRSNSRNPTNDERASYTRLGKGVEVMGSRHE